MSDKITVKPLVWKQLYEGSTMYPMEWNGVGAFSSVVYRVGQHWKGSGYYSVGNCFDTLEEAQDAAQTDYEQRILSAIDTSALTASQEEVKRLREALTPSAATKAAYIGEVRQRVHMTDPSGEEYSQEITIDWTSIKEVMKLIRGFAGVDLRAARAAEGEGK